MPETSKPWGRGSFGQAAEGTIRYPSCVASEILLPSLSFCFVQVGMIPTPQLEEIKQVCACERACVRVCGRVRAHACVRVREKESEGERESAWHGVSAYVC